MSDTIKSISPADGKVTFERTKATNEDVDATLDRAAEAQKKWRKIPVEKRAAYCTKFVEAFKAKGDKYGQDLSVAMGRPIRYGLGEVGGLIERAEHMVSIAEESLKDINVGEKAGFTRYIKREPLGVSLIIAPWNFPYMTAVNAVIPSLLAGNAVILKHAAQTLICAENFAEAFKEAGLPEGLFQVLHMSHDATAHAIQSGKVNHVSFTGSVRGGREIEKAAAGQFIALGLELGGKDPAYVSSDADVGAAVEGVIDGAFFNSGQSCCGIERIYVHEDVYDEFVEGAVKLVSDYKLGAPSDPETTLGPVVNKNAANFIRAQISDAINKGAKQLIDMSIFPIDTGQTAYLAPQILVDVDHSMGLMKDESFGPVVGIMKVSSDEEAITLMNDSEFGLTASIWTKDETKAIEIGDQIETGTCFMNRCDYLDPALSWTGVKNTGRGCSLSSIGFDHLTRPKSYHLKHPA